MSSFLQPNDIGLALYNSLLGQLAWVAGNIKLCVYLTSPVISQADPAFTGSDPRAGTPPSVLNNTAILTSASLYFLTDTFLSSLWIYAQNSGLSAAYTRAPTDAPLLFSQFEYNIAFWPQEYVAKVGNLVSYKCMDALILSNCSPN